MGLQGIGFQGLVTRFFHRSFTAQLVFDHIAFLKGVFMKSKYHFGVRFDVARKFKNGLIPFAALLMMGSVVAEEPTSACPSCSTARSGAIVAQASPWGGGGAVPASPRSAVPVRSEKTVPVSPKQYPNDIDPRVKPAPANCCGQQNIWNKDIIKKFFSFSQNPNNGNVSANAGFRFEPNFAWVQSMQTLSQFFGATLTPPGQMPNSLMVWGQLFKMNAPAGTVAYPPSWIDADSGLAIPCAALENAQYPNTQITTRKELIAFWSGFNNNSNTYTNGVWNGPGAVMSWPPLSSEYQAPHAWTMHFSHLSTNPALNPANDMVPGYFYVLKMNMELNHKKIPGNGTDWSQAPVECPPICITMIKAIGGNTRVVGGAQIKEGFN